MNFLNMSYVDVVLISNFNCALALPFVTGYTQFKGVIYATEPTLNFTKYVIGDYHLRLVVSSHVKLS